MSGRRRIIRPNVVGDITGVKNRNNVIEPLNAPNVNIRVLLTRQPIYSTYNAATKVDPNLITAYIGLGSNLGDRAGNLLLAVRCMLEASFDVVRLSSIYETEPVGLDTNLMFLNMVAEVRASNISHTQMMSRLLRIEYLLGRGDKTIKKPRTVDLDILFFGEIVVNSEFLTLPHPRLHLRRFVLEPLVEIAPRLFHPVLDCEAAEILSEVSDNSLVKRWDPNSSVASDPSNGNCC